MVNDGLHNARLLDDFKVEVNNRFNKVGNPKAANHILIQLFSNALGGDSEVNHFPDDFFYHHMRAVEFMFERHAQGYIHLDERYVLDAAQLFWRNYGKQEVNDLSGDRAEFYKKYMGENQAFESVDCHEFITMLLLKKFNGFDLNNSKASDGRNLLMITANEDWLTAASIEFLGALGADFNLRSEKYGKAIHMLNLMVGLSVIGKFNALTLGGCELSDEFEFAISHNKKLLEADTAYSMENLINLHRSAGINSELLNVIEKRIKMTINAESAMKSLPVLVSKKTSPTI